MAETSMIRVGPHQAEIVPDGIATYRLEDMFPDVDDALLATLLEGRLDPHGNLPVPYDPLLVRTPDGLILLDAGAGEEMAEAWGEPVGRTQTSLARAGVRPEEIARVAITHAHVDHIGGLAVVRHGVRVPRYPNARHYLSRTEWAFWIEPDATPTPDPWLAERARLYLPSLREAGLLELIDGEVEIAPGVRMIPAPGHTPGHMVIEIASGEAELLALGDTVLHEWDFSHPDWTTEMDADRPQTVITRRRLLERAADRRSLVHGYHLAGLGHVKRNGDAFRFGDVAA